MSGAPPTSPGWLRYRHELGIVLVYGLVLGLTLAHHEPWRDEAHYWMSARDSHSWAELWENRRYDGHPPLWSGVLYVASRCSSSLAAMKLAHWVICTLAVGVLALASPFSRIQKWVLVLGYFPLYEYGVICRNYGLGLLWLWLFCSWVGASSGRPRRYWPLGLLLLCMSQTNVHIYLVGGSLLLGLGIAWLRRPQGSSAPDIAATLGLCLASVALLLFVTRLPADTCYPTGATLDWNWARFCRCLASIWQAFVPLPIMQIEFHDTNVLHNSDLRWVAGLSVILWAGAQASLKTGSVRAIHGLGTLLLLAFAYTKILGFNRHIGHHYLLWLACLWLDNQPNRWRSVMLSLTLALQLLAGALAVCLDLAFPFSTSRQMADWIRSHQLQGLPIVVLSDYLMEPVVVWLDQPVYSLYARRWQTFVLSNLPLEPPPPPADGLEQIRQIARERGSDVLLLWDRETRFPSRAGLRVELLAQVPAGIVPSEKFFLYRFHFDPP